MENRILGLHHITAIAGLARQNHNFYTRVLGQRLVKKTVNFDDPGTYHFYFGDEVGSPGTLLTFFPWEGIQRGRAGSGQTSEIVYSVPAGSLDFWRDRLEKNNVNITGTGERFNEEYLSFEDPDGLPLTLLVPSKEDTRKPWTTDEVSADVATRGFHSVTLQLRKKDATEKVLVDLLGYKLVGVDRDRHRYAIDTVETSNIIDIIEREGDRGINAGGTIHHIAFRVKDDNVLMEFRKKIADAGHNITPKIDRNYFYSLYFREPGGVLFEIATDNPGFATDESVEELGTSLKLPPQYESNRSRIEEVLPAL